MCCFIFKQILRRENEETKLLTLMLCLEYQPISEISIKAERQPVYELKAEKYEVTLSMVRPNTGRNNERQGVNIEHPSIPKQNVAIKTTAKKFVNWYLTADPIHDRISVKPSTHNSDSKSVDRDRFRL